VAGAGGDIGISGVDWLIADWFAVGASPGYFAIGMFAGNWIGGAADWVTGGAGASATASAGVASGGSAGIGGKSDVCSTTAGELGGATGEVEETFSAVSFAHCGDAEFSVVAPPSHVGAVACGSVVGSVGALASGGTSIGDALSSGLPASGVNRGGLSLICLNRMTPATTRIVIVISGRIELIVRPP
jgi:hypothetical protein